MGSNRIHLWRALKLRKKVLVAVTALGILCTVATLFLLPRKYESKSSILLRLGRENLSVDPTVVSDVTVSPGDRKRENEINSEVQILRSRWLAEQTVQKSGPECVLGTETSVPGDTDPLDLDALRTALRGGLDTVRGWLQNTGLSEPLTREELALRKFQKSFLIRPVRNSEVIELSFRHKDAETARQLLAATLHVYLDRHLEVRQTPGAIEFFESQAQQAEEQLLEREQALTEFRNEHDIHSIKLEREILLQKVADVEKEVADFEGWLEGESRRRGRFLEEMNVEPVHVDERTTDGKPNYGLTPVYERLAHLTVEESSLASRFTDDYKPLQDVRLQIEKLELFLSDLPATLTEDSTKRNPVRINLNSQVVHSEAQIQSLTQKLLHKRGFLTDSTERLVHLEGLEADEARLAWEVDLSKRRLSEALSDLDHSRTNFALDLERISNVSVIDPPSQPIKPLGPSRLALLLGGILGTVILAVGLVLMLEYADRTFKSPDEISDMLQLPTIATVRRSHGLETFARL